MILTPMPPNVENPQPLGEKPRPTFRKRPELRIEQVTDALSEQDVGEVAAALDDWEALTLLIQS